MSTMTVPFSERRGRYRLACGCDYSRASGHKWSGCATHASNTDHTGWHAARDANAPITLLDEAPKPLAVGDVVKAKDAPVPVVARRSAGCLKGVDCSGCSCPNGRPPCGHCEEHTGDPEPTSPQYRPLFGGVALNRGFPTLLPDECAVGIEHVAPGYAVGDGCTTNHQALDDRIAEITGASPWRAKFRITQDPWRMR